MMDIIDYALAQNTDFKKFEQLSIEILKLNGYESIIPVGGIDDEGIDALLVKYYQDETKTTVFQITLQDNINSKIYSTITKLIENGIAFDELVLVTSNQINNTQSIKTKIRTKYKNKIKLEIIEQTTFITTLSVEKDIFLRYFGDIKQQLNSKLFENKTLFSDDSSETLTNSLLKCSLLFTFNDEAFHTRKALFDRTVLSILVDIKEGSVPEIVEIFKSKFFKIIPLEKVKAALDRLIKDDLVNLGEANKYIPSKSSIIKIESASAKINQGTKALINDIIVGASSVYPDKIDNNTIINIGKNIKNGLGLFFRLHGLEYCNDNANPIFKSFGFLISKNSDITSVVRKGLSLPLGDAVVYSLGETIKNPSVEQAETLVQWSKAFIGSQVMSIDPSLKEFQITNLAKKTFLIDTDFLLYCIVKETKISFVYKSIINELIKSGCKVVVTEDVILEAIKHAEFATRNYNYFKNTFDVIDELIIDEKIANVFVKGYYTALKQSSISSTTSFKRYLSNYYEPSQAYEFMQEIIKLNLNKRIVFKTLNEIDTSHIPTELLEKLTNIIYDETIKTAKAQYRSDEENKSIAYTDARQYLTAYFLNKVDCSKDANTILPGDFYLITSSVRTLRCAFKINLKQNVIVNPSTLLNIFDQIGIFSAGAKEIVNLFDNPFLYEVVNQNWDEIKKLVNAGVDLRDKNILRLKLDLQDAIHTHLSHDNNHDKIEEDMESADSDVQTKTEFDEYMEFAKVVKAKGYFFTPEIEALLSKFKELEASNNLKDELISDMQLQAGVHIKKTNYYLNKINKKKK